MEKKPQKGYVGKIANSGTQHIQAPQARPQGQREDRKGSSHR